MDWLTGIATSNKSINLGDKTYQTASSLRSTLKRYLNGLDEFKGAKYDGVEVLGSQINEKVLRIAIPPAIRYRPTKQQLDVLDEIRKLAKEKLWNGKEIRLIIEEVNG